MHTRPMVKQITSVTKKEMRWTPRLVKQLRGKRTLADFGALIGASKNTVRRWEVGQAQPDATYAERLSELAQRENFLKDWKLVGSMTLVGDLESAKAEISELFRKSVKRSAGRARF
ncbi:MAG: helix-turn-helix domain-containing protein [Blastocatellia bacterium]